MQQDVRRSDTTVPARDDPARADAEPAPKAGLGSLFRFGGKRTKREAQREQGRLHDRLKEVLERDRALIAAQPAVEELAPDEAELHEDDNWSEATDPFGEADPEPHTGTHAHADEHEVLWSASALDEPFAAPNETGTRPTQRNVLQRTEARESADLRLSQIACWIEEEIGEEPEGAGPLTLDAPLDEHEAAELDAVLSAPDDGYASARLSLVEALDVELPDGEPEVEAPSSQRELAPAAAPVEEPAVEAPAVAEAHAEGAPVEPALADETLISASPALQQALAEPPRPRSAPSSRAQVKAKVSARPAPRDDDAAPVGKEPINTLTMARLLAMQGYKPRALAVYRELLKRTPDDEALRAEYEALKKAD